MFAYAWTNWLETISMGPLSYGHCLSLFQLDVRDGSKVAARMAPLVGQAALPVLVDRPDGDLIDLTRIMGPRIAARATVELDTCASDFVESARTLAVLVSKP